MGIILIFVNNNLKCQTLKPTPRKSETPSQLSTTPKREKSTAFSNKEAMVTTPLLNQVSCLDLKPEANGIPGRPRKACPKMMPKLLTSSWSRESLESDPPLQV